MSYYVENRDEILKAAYNRYHNKGGKEKTVKYYRKNADLLKYEANMKYKNMSKKEKNKKRKCQRERHNDPKHNEYLKQCQKIYDNMKKIKNHCVKKMSEQKMTFGDKTISKKVFYSSMQAISLDLVDKSKIIVSNKWKINITTNKCFIGYVNEDIIKPLCIILHQMSGYIKYFDDGGKNMSLKIENKDIYSEYSDIWNKIKKLLNVKFNSLPIHNEEYIKTKAKIFNDVNNTSFTNNEIPKEKNHYFCIAAINIDSIMKIEKKVYPQVYLEQCKYKLKRRKPVDFINNEAEPSSESDYESDS